MFVADLPTMSPEHLAKLYTWGKNTCVRFDVHMKDDGLTLIAERKKEGTARDHQRNLRTLLLSWQVPLQDRQNGWLRLVDQDHIPTSVGQSEAASDQPAATSEVAAAQPQQMPAENKPPEVNTTSAPIMPQLDKPCATTLQLPKNLLHNGGAAFAALAVH